MFYPIQLVLPRAAVKLGIKREFDAAIVCERYRKLAPKIVHEQALLHTSPRSYKKKILTIQVSNSSWAHQVASHKNDLIKEINASLSRQAIEQIKTYIGDVNETKPIQN